MTMPGSHRATVSPTAGPPRDFVFTFSYETFADALMRGMMRPPDRVLETLIESPEVRRLLVADPYRPWTTAWARDLMNSSHRPRESDKVRHARPLRAQRVDPEDLPRIERVYARYEHAVRKAAFRAELQSPAFITVNPLVAGFAQLDWAGPALYYARDDWLSSPSRRRYWPAYREAYQRIADSGRAVAAVSQEIIDRIEPTGPHQVVPNGIDPSEWLGSQPEPPEWFAKIPGPRAVYLGTLDSRLDVDGLRSLALARTDLQIVLIGGVPQRAHLASLIDLKNVHVRSEIRRAEVVAVLRNAELTLLAHQKTPLTEAMSPLKVYEYLAAGRPVLATDLGPVRHFGSRVHRAASVAEFVDLVDPALAQGIQGEAGRVAFVEENAWSTRHRQILSLLDK